MARNGSLRKEVNAYREVKSTTDKPLAYYYYLIRMFPEVADVDRFGSNQIIQNFAEHININASVGGHETSFPQSEDKEPTKIISRAINGQLVFDAPRRRTFGLIDENGTTPFRGSLRFELNEGLEEASHAHHFEKIDDQDETIIFVLFLAPDRFEWLWREMTLRPHGKLLLDFACRVYQHEVDRHLAEPHHPQEYLVEKGGQNPITEISVSVRDTYPAPTPAAPTKRIDDLEDKRHIEVPTAQIVSAGRVEKPKTSALLRWIIVMQVLILIAIIAA